MTLDCQKVGKFHPVTFWRTKAFKIKYEYSSFLNSVSAHLLSGAV